MNRNIVIGTQKDEFVVLKMSKNTHIKFIVLIWFVFKPPPQKLTFFGFFQLFSKYLCDFR